MKILKIKCCLSIVYVKHFLEKKQDSLKDNLVYLEAKGPCHCYLFSCMKQNTDKDWLSITFWFLRLLPSYLFLCFYKLQLLLQFTDQMLFLYWKGWFWKILDLVCSRLFNLYTCCLYVKMFIYRDVYFGALFLSLKILKIVILFNSFHSTYLVIYLLKTWNNWSFTDVFRGYRKRPVAWNGLILNTFVRSCD